MKLDIRPVSFGTADHLAVQRLRYAVYAEEGAYDLPGIDHAQKTLTDAADAGAITVGAFDAGQAIGTIRLTPLPLLPHDDCERRQVQAMGAPLAFDRQFVVGRLMVQATRRGSLLAPSLFAMAYRLAARAGLELGGLGCCPRHVSLYESIGCRVAGHPITHGELGLLVPMAFLMRDVDHLRRVGSQLLAVADGVEPHAELVAWFDARYAQVVRPRSVGLMPDQQRAQLHAELKRLSAPVLHDLPDEFAPALIRTGAVLSIDAGRLVVPAGCKSTELFLVLDGQVSLRSAGDRSEVGHVVDPADVFAEDGCLGLTRATFAWNAVATRATRRLAISAETVAALAQRYPRPAALLRERLLRSRICRAEAA